MRSKKKVENTKRNTNIILVNMATKNQTPIN